MGRRKQHDEIEQTNVVLPSSVITQVRLLLTDPFTGKMKYGALSGLITQLLREWLQKQQALAAAARNNRGGQVQLPQQEEQSVTVAQEPTDDR